MALVSIALILVRKEFFCNEIGNSSNDEGIVAVMMNDSLYIITFVKNDNKKYLYRFDMNSYNIQSLLAFDINAAQEVYLRKNQSF